MGLSRIAKAFGLSALVIRRFSIREQGPVFVEIEGRRSGLTGWFMAFFGFDASTVFRVYATHVEVVSKSLAGHIKEMVPLSRTSRMNAAYLKPFGYLFAALGMSAWTYYYNMRYGVSCEDLIKICFSAAGLIWLYFFNKCVMLEFMPKSGESLVIAYKRSIIEGQNIDEQTAQRIIALIQRLVGIETVRGPDVESPAPRVAAPAPNVGVGYFQDRSFSPEGDTQETCPDPEIPFDGDEPPDCLFPEDGDAESPARSIRSRISAILPYVIISGALICIFLVIFLGGFRKTAESHVDEAADDSVSSAEVAETPVPETPSAEEAPSAEEKPKPAVSNAVSVCEEERKPSSEEERSVPVPKAADNPVGQDENDGRGGELAAVTHFLSMQTNTLVAARQKLIGEMSAIKEDGIRMSAKIREVSGKRSRAGKSSGAVLYALMRDSELNEIAMRRLGVGFAVDCAEFEDRFRTVRTARKEIEAARKENESKFDNAGKRIRRRENAARQAFEDEVRSGRQEMESLEKQIRRLKNSFFNPAEKNKMQRKERELESRLSGLERKFGSGEIRHTEYIKRSLDEIARKSNNELRQAELGYKRTDAELERRLKDLQEEEAVIAEYRKRTLVRLEARIAEDSENLETDIGMYDEQIEYLCNAANGLHLLDREALKKLHRNLEHVCREADKRRLRQDSERRKDR